MAEQEWCNANKKSCFRLEGQIEPPPNVFVTLNNNQSDSKVSSQFLLDVLKF